MSSADYIGNAGGRNGQEAILNTRALRNRPAYTLDRETAPAMWLVGTLWLIQATGVQTGNHCSMLEQVMPAGLGPPAHRHPYAVEGFYIVEGRMDFHVNGQIIPAEAGTVVHLPRMLAHTFTVASEETRVLNWYAPAGNELHVITLARPAEERRRPTFAESAPPVCDETNQIISRLYGSVAVDALPFSVPPSEELLVTPPDGWRAGSLKMSRADQAPSFQLFGLEWRLLVAGVDTNDDYDLFEVNAMTGAGLPRRILGTDEAIYVLEGSISLDRDGDVCTAAAGSFSYTPAGAVSRWHALESSRLLVFHFPGGFDRALAGSRGEDALAAAWLEASGTRFLEQFPLDAAILNGRPVHDASSATVTIPA